MAYPSFSNISAATYAIPAGVGIWRFRKLNKPMKVLVFLTVIACLELGVEFSVAYWKHYNNFVSTYYEFVEFCLLCSIFFMFIDRRGSRVALIALASVYVVIWVIKIPTFYNPAIVAGDVEVLSRIFLVTLSLITLQSILDLGTARLIDTPVFWVVAGVVLYSAGTLLVMGLSTQLMKFGRAYFLAAWDINWALNIVTNLFYTKAFSCKQQASE